MADPMEDVTIAKQHTNGRARVERSIAEPRRTIESRKRRSGLRRLLIPALFAAGVVLLMRRFEDSTSD